MIGGDYGRGVGLCTLPFHDLNISYVVGGGIAVTSMMKSYLDWFICFLIFSVILPSVKYILV